MPASEYVEGKFINDCEGGISPPEMWQPIETAPKDGTWFLTFSPDNPEHGCDFAVFDPELETFCKVCCGYQYATHWMPLPEPPKE